MPETKTKADDPFRVGSLLKAVRAAVEGNAGASASLRRLDPERPVGSPALYAVLADAGIPGDALRDGGMTRYATCVRIAALLENLDSEGKSPGSAFAEVEVSEQRVARLTSARDGTLRDAVTSVVRRCLSQGVRCNPWTLCELVLADGVDDSKADAARDAIMRAYYGRRDSMARPTA